MKKILIAFALLLSSAFINPAYAEDVDINTYPCQKFLASPDEMPLVIFWIDGYLSAYSDQAVLSQEWMENLSGQIVSYCKANPNNSLMQAIEAVE